MKDTDYAWAAGIIDGEGSITISNGRGTRRATPSNQLYVYAAMTHEPTIKKLLLFFGGSVVFQKAKEGRNHRPTYRWIVCDDRALRTLKLLAPYLVTKKKQALLGMRFRTRCKQPVGAASTSRRLTALKLRYWEQMRDLNRRGLQCES